MVSPKENRLVSYLRAYDGEEKKAKNIKIIKACILIYVFKVLIRLWPVLSKLGNTTYRNYFFMPT